MSTAKCMLIEETIATVEASEQIGLCPSSLWTILGKNLGLRIYRIQLEHEQKRYE